eukprot:gene12449-biopygen3440
MLQGCRFSVNHALAGAVDIPRRMQREPGETHEMNPPRARVVASSAHGGWERAQGHGLPKSPSHVGPGRVSSATEGWCPEWRCCVWLCAGVL